MDISPLNFLGTNKDNMLPTSSVLVGDIPSPNTLNSIHAKDKQWINELKRCSKLNGFGNFTEIHSSDSEFDDSFSDYVGILTKIDKIPKHTTPTTTPINMHLLQPSSY